MPAEERDCSVARLVARAASKGRSRERPEKPGQGKQGQEEGEARTYSQGSFQVCSLYSRVRETRTLRTGSVSIVTILLPLLSGGDSG